MFHRFLIHLPRVQALSVSRHFQWSGLPEKYIMHSPLTLPLAVNLIFPESVA